MMSGMRAGAIVVLVVTAGLLQTGGIQAQGTGQDTSRAARRSTASEYQAQRRQLLDEQRAGALDTPPVYGSARVGAGSYPRNSRVGPGAATGQVIGGRSPAHPSPFGPPPVAGGEFGLIPFDGILEYGYGYGWGGYGYRRHPLQSWGWSSAPGAAFGFAPWPGIAGSDCALVQIFAESGSVHEIFVALRPMGIARAVDLDLAIDERLSRGLPVDLIGIDGRRLRLQPGALLEDIRVLPCPRD